MLGLMQMQAATHYCLHISYRLDHIRTDMLLIFAYASEDQPGITSSRICS